MLPYFFMQMAPPLTLSSLGFSPFSKPIQPLLIGHDRRLTHGCRAKVVTGPVEHWPGAWGHRFVSYQCPDSVVSAGGRVCL